RFRAGGWYFSSDAAFDLAVAYQLDYPEARDPRPRLLEAIAANLDYEQGCNPPNVVYLTGLGYHRQREIVDQYAQNDRRILPPTGIPLGNLQAGFGWLDKYGKDLGTLSFPSDGADKAPYPLYDRWADAFNLTQEFVILNQARALAYTAWLMARTPLRTQPWRSVFGSASKTANSGLALSAPGLDLHSALTVWEAANWTQPLLAQTSGTNILHSDPAWVEAEAQLPDGRRVFVVTNSSVLK
ncbi:MAG TPA: glycoside hydrolase family 9, partial [Verrucomicrobiae bacterium]